MTTPSRARAHEANARENLVLRLRAEARQRRKLAGTRGLLELVERANGEALVQRVDAPRPESRHAQHLEETVRRFLAQSLVHARHAGFYDFTHDRGRRRTKTGDLLELTRACELGDVTFDA